MGTVATLPLGRRQAPDMHYELMAGIRDGFNRIVEIRQFDKEATRVMMGYLSAGAIALRCNGLDGPAQEFVNAAQAIECNWGAFEHVIRRLLEQFNASL